VATHPPCRRPAIALVSAFGFDKLGAGAARVRRLHGYFAAAGFPCRYVPLPRPRVAIPGMRMPVQVARIGRRLGLEGDVRPAVGARAVPALASVDEDVALVVTATRRAWLAAMEAKAHAGLGDAMACSEALGGATDAIEHAGSPENRLGTDFFDMPRLLAIKGTCALLLRQPKAAQVALAEGLAGSPWACGASSPPSQPPWTRPRVPNRSRTSKIRRPSSWNRSSVWVPCSARRASRLTRSRQVTNGPLPG
jgi:hypothetical protein